MILLMSHAPAAAEYAETLLALTKKKVHLAADYRGALEYVHDHEVGVIVFDESSLGSDLNESLDVVKHAGTALAVRVNFAVHGEQRITEEVKEALRRLQRERVLAQRAAQGEMRSQVNSEVTAILMASQMALNAPSLTTARSKMEEVHRVAERLRQRLKAGA